MSVGIRTIGGVHYWGINDLASEKAFTSSEVPVTLDVWIPILLELDFTKKIAKLYIYFK